MVSSVPDNICINLGFADKVNSKHQFKHESFPCKIGGDPVMLFPIENSLFECEYCAGRLTFLLQLYSILDSVPNCYHRTLYLFFCAKCYQIRSSFKCIRLQLPENSKFYTKNKAVNLTELEEYKPQLNSNLVLKPEYSVFIEEESPKAQKLFISHIKEINQGLIKEDIEDLEYDPMLSKQDNALINKLMQNYTEEDSSKLTGEEKVADEAEDEFLSKLAEKSLFKPNEDIVFKFFTNVIKDNPHQVIRYCKDGIEPLWYSKMNMPSSSTKLPSCKNCGKRLAYEFQIMPYIFNLYNELMNHDIGTIVIYTCDCDTMISEEFVYVQRTGEKTLDIEGVKEKLKIMPNELEVIDESKISGFGASGEPDEDGFVEVKSKKKGKKIESIKEQSDDDWEEDK